MSYYPDPSWPAPGPAGRQPSWEQPQPPSRSGMRTLEALGMDNASNRDSGANSTVSRDEDRAFVSQFDEVERAMDNLTKSGKFVPYQMGPPQMMGAGPGRRESLPVMGPGPRPFPEYGHGGNSRHHSVSHQADERSPAFYQNQRYPPRPENPDQMAQAKRRMAAQRERELRNYHQEQQYHRNVSGSKSDRSMSPNTMSEEERRELIARQHRALYGDQSSLYTTNNPTSSQDVRVNSAGAGRGHSPLAFDPFGMQSQNASNEGSVQMPSRDRDSAGGAQEARANSNSSPSSNQNPAFSLFETTQQASRTSNSSPGGSPPRQGNKPNGSGVAPIGTRPVVNQGQPAGAPLSKRATTPLPSPLSYTYNASEQNGGMNTTSASLNPSSTMTDNGPIWGNKKGVWGNTASQGVQASVWG